MKFKIFSILLIVFSFSFVSCSKSSATHTYSIAGSWTGTRTIDNTPTRVDLGVLTSSFEIRADSSISIQWMGNDGNTAFYQGSWSLAGSAFKASVSGAGGTSLVLTAIFNSSGTLSNGKWENVNGSASGTFDMKRNSD
jgi:hypothetical protein